MRVIVSCETAALVIPFALCREGRLYHTSKEMNVHIEGGGRAYIEDTGGGDIGTLILMSVVST